MKGKHTQYIHGKCCNLGERRTYIFSYIKNRLDLWMKYNVIHSY